MVELPGLNPILSSILDITLSLASVIISIASKKGSSLLHSSISPLYLNTSTNLLHRHSLCVFCGFSDVMALGAHDISTTTYNYSTVSQQPNHLRNRNICAEQLLVTMEHIELYNSNIGHGKPMRV